MGTKGGSARDRAAGAAPADGEGVEQWPPSTVVTRSLGILFGGGAALAVPAFALDRAPGAHDGIAVVVLGLAVVGAAAVLVRTGRTGRGLGPVGVHGTLVVALAVITTVVWCGHGDPTSVAAIELFAWPPLFASAFLSRRHAVPYVAAAAALSVLVVAAAGDQTQVSCAISAVGTIVVAAVTAAFLRGLLLRSSTTDPLTGLPDRHALPGLLGRELARAERQGTALCLAILDLDDFKAVNDTGGHRAGDELLRQVSQRWRHHLHPGHEIVRYGGDEFVVVLPGCDAAGAAAVVDGLRRAGGQPCSVGLAGWIPGEAADTTLARADAALYEAKRRGGDRVVGPPPDRTSGAAPLSPCRANPRWRGFRPPAERRAAPSFRAQLLGAFFVVGAVITLPGIVLDPAPHTAVPVAVGNAVGCMLAGLALVAVAHRVGDRFPMWVVHAGMVLAVLVLCSACLFARGAPAGIVSLSMVTWAAMYVTALFPWPVAAAYCASGFAAVGATVGVAVRSNPASVGLLCVGAAMGAGALIGYLALVLHRRADVDALTGLPNRRALESVLEREVALADRTGLPLCVALIDLDHLKTVNDTDGHMAGDRVLRRFATTWCAALRPTDALIRFGGDEFVLVLPGCDLPAGADTLTRLRGGGAWPCSVGLTCRQAGDGPDTLLARADAALYRAKAEGRDRVVTVGVAHTASDSPAGDARTERATGRSHGLAG